MYYKKGMIKGKWRFVTLSDTEAIEIEKAIRNDNLKIMAECIRDSSQLFPKFPPIKVGDDTRNFRDMVRSNIAVALFERRADAKFTRIQSALDHKIKQAEEGTVYTTQFKPKATGTITKDLTDTNKLRQGQLPPPKPKS